jgi:hypothetical protein
MASTTSNLNDDALMIADLYLMVISSLKKASLFSHPTEVTCYFNPEVKEEIPDGVNSRGRVVLSCFFAHASTDIHI